MTITALLSGQAGLALIRGARTQIRAIDAPPREVVNEAQALAVFDGCSDVRVVAAANIAELDILLRRHWTADRALQLTLLLLDPRETETDRFEYAECVESLLSEPVARSFLERRLATAPLNAVEQVALLKQTERTPVLSELLGEIVSLQDAIEKVAAAFASIGLVEFGGDATKKAKLRKALIDDGAFLNLARGLAREESLSFRQLELTSQHRASSRAIGAWIAALDPNVARARPRKLDVELDDMDELDFDSEGVMAAPSRAAFEQVRAQIKTITEMLDKRDLAGARRLAHALVEQQRFTSTSEQIAKSLSSLAMSAKRREIFDLQLDWARRAAEENPTDPIAHGHLADALMSVSQYESAFEALDEVEASGDRRFAETRRAQILLELGKPEQARSKFLEAASEFSDTEGVEYSEMGAADCLRVMGRYEEARAEYTALTEKYPLKPKVWAGYATLQVAVGDLDHALQTFSKAGASSTSLDERVRADNGRATALRLSGRFEEAIALFDQTIDKAPNNSVALTGKAGALRAAGKYDAALMAYDVAIERCPFSPYPLDGKAKALRELRRFDEAARLYNEGRAKFPHDQNLLVGAIQLRRSRGEYELGLEEVTEALRSYPYNTTLRILLADLLSRTGAQIKALTTYNQVIGELPRHGRAVSGKAALLLKLGRRAEARALLDDAAPRTQSEWSRYLLRAFLIQEDESAGKAARLLLRGSQRCPFAHERRLLRSALAKLELDRGRLRDARRIVEDAPTQVSNIIAFHVLAAAQRPGHARARYNDILSEGAPAEVIDLVQEIARRHNFIEGGARHSKAWIARAERDVLLAEAA